MSMSLVLDLLLLGSVSLEPGFLYVTCRAEEPFYFVDMSFRDITGKVKRREDVLQDQTELTCFQLLVSGCLHHA